MAASCGDVQVECDEEVLVVEQAGERIGQPCIASTGIGDDDRSGDVARPLLACAQLLGKALDRRFGGHATLDLSSDRLLELTDLRGHGGGSGVEIIGVALRSKGKRIGRSSASCSDERELSSTRCSRNEAGRCR